MVEVLRILVLTVFGLSGFIRENRVITRFQMFHTTTVVINLDDLSTIILSGK